MHANVRENLANGPEYFLFNAFFSVYASKEKLSKHSSFHSFQDPFSRFLYPSISHSFTPSHSLSLPRLYVGSRYTFHIYSFFCSPCRCLLLIYKHIKRAKNKYMKKKIIISVSFARCSWRKEQLFA